MSLIVVTLLYPFVDSVTSVMLLANVEGVMTLQIDTLVKSPTLPQPDNLAVNESDTSLPTAIDLFSGCGGLTLGLKQAGFRVLGAVEIDKLAVETYKKNHPEVQVWDKNIELVSAADVRTALKLSRGELDLLAGCPPCQGFSQMRTLNGKHDIDDPNNDLVFSFMDYVREFEPKSIMIENVPELATDYRIDCVLSELKQLGYFVHPNIIRVLDTAHYGVPQRRHRMILLTGRLGPIQFAPRDPNRQTVRGAIATMPAPGDSGDDLHDFPERRSQRVSELIRKIPKDGGSRTQLDKSEQLPCHQRMTGFKDVYGRMKWNDVAPTLTSGCTNPSKGRFLHPEQDRAITLREAALLQSFPRDYYFSLAKGKLAVAKMIGNALPPEFTRQHADYISQYLTQQGR